MIPRTKVNYTAGELLRAVLISERGSLHKKALLSLLGDYLGTPHILLMPSGRGALYFILRALDQPRVLIPAYTCSAVVEAALLAGKEVAFIECEADGFNMCPQVLERTLDSRSIVIATHQFGIPCAIDRMQELCAAHGAVLIEDAAASFGTRIDGRLTGTLGDVGFFSFDSTKLINVPMKGGFIVCRDGGLLRRIEARYREEIRAMPMRKKAEWLAKGFILVCLANHWLYRLFYQLAFALRGKVTEETGVPAQMAGDFYRYELGNWQAYLAARQLRQIDSIIAARQRAYREYRRRLAGCRAFALPPADGEGEWACIRFPIRVHADKMAYYRRAARLGVDFAFAFTHIACPDEFRRAKSVARSVLDLPFYLKLSRQEMQKVIAVLERIDNEPLGEQP